MFVEFPHVFASVKVATITGEHFEEKDSEIDLQGDIMKPNEMYIFPSPTIHGSMNNQPTWRQTTEPSLMLTAPFC